MEYALGYFVGIGIPFVFWKLNLLNNPKYALAVGGLFFFGFLFFIEELRYLQEVNPFWSSALGVFIWTSITYWTLIAHYIYTENIIPLGCFGVVATLLVIYVLFAILF